MGVCRPIDCLCHTEGGSGLVPDKLGALAAMLVGRVGVSPFLSCHLAALLACHSEPFLDSHLPHLNGDISEGRIPEKPLTDGWGSLGTAMLMQPLEWDGEWWMCPSSSCHGELDTHLPAL